MEKIVHLLIMYTMLVLMLLLFHKGRKHPRSLMLALYALVEVITNGFISLNMVAGWGFFDRFPFIHFIYKPLYCLWVPLFYLYFRYCLSAFFKLQRKHWVHFIPFLVFLFFFCSIILLKGNLYIWENLYKDGSFLYYCAYAVDVTVKMQYLVYCFVMIRLMVLTERKKFEEQQLVYSTSIDTGWLRFIVYGYTIGCFIATITLAFYTLNNPASTVINLVSVTYFFLFFFAIFYNTITHKLYEEELKPRVATLPNDELKRLMDRIDMHIAGNKLYLQPELSLQQIAQSLNEKERIVSQAINTIKERNINDYINCYRIEHACKLLLEDKERAVFEIMYESGFSTKGAFNMAFKKVTGKTPTQYREEKG